MHPPTMMTGFSTLSLNVKCSRSESRTSVELLAAVNKRLKTGVVRIAEEHARDLHPTVEVSKP